MDERGNDSARSLRDLAEEALFAGIGAAALTKDRADELVDELAERGKMTREESRAFVDDLANRWRGDAVRFGERSSAALGDVLRSLGIVTRREYEELELRLAQLEHRLRLVEREPPVPPGPGP
jgi:polyhydroxyalkanoate synthesis regulator phasin